TILHRQGATAVPVERAFQQASGKRGQDEHQNGRFTETPTHVSSLLLAVRVPASPEPSGHCGHIGVICATHHGCRGSELPDVSGVIDARAGRTSVQWDHRASRAANPPTSILEKYQAMEYCDPMKALLGTGMRPREGVSQQGDMAERIENRALAPAGAILHEASSSASQGTLAVTHEAVRGRQEWVDSGHYRS